MSGRRGGFMSRWTVAVGSGAGWNDHGSAGHTHPPRSHWLAAELRRAVQSDAELEHKAVITKAGPGGRARVLAVQELSIRGGVATYNAGDWRTRSRFIDDVA